MKSSIRVVDNVTTYHKLLNLVPITRSDDGPLKPNQPTVKQTSTPSFRNTNLVIIDECSMIGRELFSYATDISCPVLFTGDSAQLKPVNEYKISPTFNAGPRYVLEEVMRHEGAILTLATRARKLTHPQILPEKDRGTEVLTYADEAELITAWQAALTTSTHQADNNEDPLILVCWKNDNRRKFNKLARQTLFGPDVPDFMKDDRLVMLSAYVQGNTVLIDNNDDVIVESAWYIDNHQPCLTLDFFYSVWKLKLYNNVTIYVIDDQDRKRLRQDIRNLGKEIAAECKETGAIYDAKRAICNKKWAQYNDLLQEKEESDDDDYWVLPDSFQQKLEQAKAELLLAQRDLDYAETLDFAARSRWPKEYYFLKEYFAEVDFGYACTIHKSQGSTYKEVFVLSDYENSSERKELLYVAVTRAKERVHHQHVQIRRPQLALAA